MRKLNRDFGRISKVDVFTKSFFFLIGAAAKLANPCDVNYDALSPIFWNDQEKKLDLPKFRREIINEFASQGIDYL